ncbi:hypothetical protein QOT17_018139 [Balamuthia mandrillaris]
MSQSPEYGVQADIWPFGAIMFCLVTLLEPYFDVSLVRRTLVAIALRFPRDLSSNDST